MIKPALDSDKETIVVDNLNTLLVNIGRPDQILSEEELTTLVEEAGGSDRAIPASKVLQLV